MCKLPSHGRSRCRRHRQPRPHPNPHPNPPGWRLTDRSAQPSHSATGPSHSQRRRSVRAAPPADGGGLPLQGYRWSVTGATVRGGTLASSGGVFNITLYDLTIGEHTFTVNAFNARGDGPSASFNFTVTAPPRRDPTLQAALDLLTSGGTQLASLWAEFLEKQKQGQPRSSSAPSLLPP